MQTKLLMLLAIIVLLTLMLYVMQSGKKHRQADNTLTRLGYTLRSLALIVAVLLFLIFGVLR